MINSGYALILIAVMAGVTAMLRFLPFIVFSKNTPKLIIYLGNVLPYSVMAMLVVYCLKSTDLAGPSHGIPELLSVAGVAVLHKWKHNTLVSILAGTVLYMLLIHIL